MSVDTLKWKDTLVDGGIADDHARAIVNGLSDHVLPDLATKSDIERVIHTLTMRFVTLGLAIAALIIAVLSVTIPALI